jgi:hypothetical protein
MAAIAMAPATKATTGLLATAAPVNWAGAEVEGLTGVAEGAGWVGYAGGAEAGGAGTDAGGAGGAEAGGAGTDAGGAGGAGTEAGGAGGAAVVGLGGAGTDAGGAGGGTAL